MHVFLPARKKIDRFGAFLISIRTLIFSDMELVNTGRRVRNPLQRKGFRRFQNCRHRPPQTRKYQVRTRLEIGIASWNAPPEKVLIYAGFRGFENEKIFEFSPSVLPIFQSGLGEDTTWRVVRVVEGATLEKSCAARHLGFESLTLRQPEKPVLPASLFYSWFPIPKPASIASAEITFELYSRCA